jgi:hypothetical protein
MPTRAAEDDPVWISLLSLGLICLDLRDAPATIRLTGLGGRYPNAS